MSRALQLYQQLARWPGGHWLFARLICWQAPYFATISPRFLALAPARCEIDIRDRRRVHNHIGTVHAIALCGVAELAGGLMTDVTLPAALRWIPKGMQVEYFVKAVGTMHATATPAAPLESAVAGQSWPVRVSVRNDEGVEVFRAHIDMWLSRREP